MEFAAVSNRYEPSAFALEKSTTPIRYPAFESRLVMSTESNQPIMSYNIVFGCFVRKSLVSVRKSPSSVKISDFLALSAIAP